MLDFQRVNFNPQVVFFFFFLVMRDERIGSLKTETEQTVHCSHCAVILIVSGGVQKECDKTLNIHTNTYIDTQINEMKTDLKKYIVPAYLHNIDKIK